MTFLRNMRKSLVTEGGASKNKKHVEKVTAMNFLIDFENSFKEE